ncbi:Inosine/xanthosine triphosphate pyrophosphatase,all-alpha NTP-PPase family [Halalkaliarchaeum sp. AArc-CO]|uniref:non-canonical purine NTP pyrophosphatase n=1 Tax=unclassified Halalkaliarchaeum TaxID=2678344 RepID=UPI00217E8025|nr:MULTISPECIES: non-canonical purine NTP pyrophosphatase [unclassified Halalkaliarchaeum]MDR5673390.1 non-canonical purine NTP pyrophosphatase [Halalkaliarchaeum sp. AArc-GB]UWG49731.1 Inosine/xanthosine triphosphate pyrophosphatase,all-alpha NTP-PPase family [Halalkaliarchaeum sp. AArc-CO]
MLRYVTTNEGKMREAADYLGDGAVEQFDYDYVEIQSDDPGTIAAHGAREAYRACGEPVITDDAGLFVDALNGFPGTYSSFVEDTLGIERVARIALAEEDTRASFRCVLAYCDGGPFEAAPDTVARDDRAVAAASSPGGSDPGGSSPNGSSAGTEGAESETLPVKLFEGYVPGRIVEPRGDGGFGYDPIFEHGGTTFAEMDAAEKNALSHRGRALAKFAEWFQARRDRVE